MKIIEEDIETLTGLGLTSLQAKIYLTLCRTGQTNIKSLAKNAEVARQEASRATQELLSLGLITKVISRPTNYTPLPVIDSTEMLLNLREQKTAILRQKREQLIKRVNARQVSSFVATEPKFLLIPSGEGGVLQSLKFLNNTKVSYEGIFFPEVVLKIPLKILNAYEKFLLSDAGKMRIIITQARNSENLQKVIQHLESKGSFEARTTHKNLLSPLAVHDRKEFFCTNNLKRYRIKRTVFTQTIPYLLILL